MSFLDSNNSEVLSVRITKKGRKSIAEGNFNISYFQVGDSEFDYNSPFTGLTGILGTPSQKVFTSFDRESGVKYPYKLDSTSGSTTFGIPIDESSTETLRNVMGAAGFISSHIPYNITESTGTTVECYTMAVNPNEINGGSTINVTNGNLYQNCDYITLVFNEFGGIDPNSPVVTGNSNSLIFRVTGITDNTLYLDRPTPNLDGIVTTDVQVVCNKCENEYQDCQTTVNYQGQLNPWTLNVVWGDKPIGGDVSAVDESLTGYTSNVYVSTKELLGYTTSTAQTFTNSTGGTITTPTSFKNSYDEEISIPSNEQRCIAIVHYSELGDSTIDTDRFFKYDDYISYNDSTVDTIATDNDGIEISDTEYFEVYIPFIYYHRNTGTTLGAIFKMDSNDNYIKSTYNSIHELLFRYLVDEQGNKVGKIFPHNKTIVFDDQELVALLDYRSNRRYTLPSPKLLAIPSDDIPSNSLLSGTTGQTVWVTYMFEYTGDTQLNGLPCNYFNSIKIGNVDECNLTAASNVGVRFNTDSFNYMQTSINDITDGYIANKFYILAQLVDTGDLPQSNSWRIIDFTIEAGGDGTILLDPTDLVDITFIINKTDYDSASIFDLEDYLGTGNYLGDTSWTTQPQFGDEQPFPGSIKVVRSSDIETMNFLINLPSTQFLTTQNPTYQNGTTKKITDITLLNDTKEVMVVAKLSTPITRVGSQVFSLKLDF